MLKFSQPNKDDLNAAMLIIKDSYANEVCIKSILNTGEMITMKFTSAVKTYISDLILSLLKTKNLECQFKLDFSDCGLDDENVKHLLEVFVKRQIPVVDLNLSFNNITDSSAKILATFIEKSAIQFLTLKTSLLDITGIPHLSHKVGALIREAVLKSETLIDISLSGHSLSHEDMRIIGTVTYQRKLINEMAKNLREEKKINVNLNNEVNEIRKKLENAEDVLSKLETTYKELFEGNSTLSLEGQLRSYNVNKIIKVQSAARGFFARKQYKTERDNRIHEIEQTIQDSLNKKDYKTVASLSELLEQGKLHDAIQLKQRI